MDLDDLSKEMASLFHKFVKNGKIEQWHKLTEEAINSKNGAENTALHQVSKEGNLSMAKYLIRYGAQIDVKNMFGQTPLHCTAYRNELEVMKLLISSGAQVNVRNEVGRTPLTIAAASEYF